MRTTVFFIFSFLILSVSSSAQNNAVEKPDYLNPELSFETRVNDLVSRMTLEEKVSQMIDVAKPVERLQITEYN